MSDILSDFVSEPRVTILGRVRYAVLDKSRIKSIQITLAQIRKDFAFMLNFFNMKAIDEQLRNGSQSIDLLNSIHKRQFADQDARKAE